MIQLLLYWLNPSPSPVKDFNPSPSPVNPTKYAQPLELILFYVIAFRIYCLKDFHYPHLLNNYLIIYLIFLGSYRKPS